ncbi:MAG: hypothetical protein ACE5GX_01980 [Thermoanaerobaculia bacterium]
MSEPVSGSAPATSNKPTIALILGILGIICCGLLAPVAWYIGSQELKAIAAGAAPAAGEGLAKAGMILGIIGTILLVLTLLWVFFAGGMAVLQGFSA